MVDFNAVAKHYRQKVNQAGYKHDPVSWASDRLEVWLWSKQREILNALVTHKKVAVKTTHSVGKTFTAALASSWWVDTRGVNSVVVSSAPTYDQVHGLLWEEIRKFHIKAGLPGRVTQDDRWQLPYVVDGRSSDVMVGQGRKPADTNIHGFQGMHRPEGVLVILDEACGIPDTIYTGAEAITTAPMDRILAIGNPDDPNTEFGRIFAKAPEDWYLITVSAFDTPNFTDEWVPDYLRRSLPQPEWVESRRKDWGEDSNRYKSKILAEFPETSEDSLFNKAYVEAAVRAVTRPKKESVAPRLGVDVARYGSDRTVVSKYHNGNIEIVDAWSMADTIETATKIARIAEDVKASEIRVDAIGVGAGVSDQLAGRVGPHTLVYDMVGNAASPDPAKWYNARAYWYDSLRKKLVDGEIDLPDHETLIDEFAVIKYVIRGSALLIESKEDMKKRGVKSPDFLDSVVYACADLDFSGITGISEGDVVDAEDVLPDLFEDWSDFVIAPV